MDLIAAEPLKLVRIERLAKRLLADQRPVRQLLAPGLEPWKYLFFEEAAQALGIGGCGCLILLELVRGARQHVRPPFLSILAQSRERGLIGVIAPGAEQVESAARHCIISCHVSS